MLLTKLRILSNFPSCFQIFITSLKMCNFRLRSYTGSATSSTCVFLGFLFRFSSFWDRWQLFRCLIGNFCCCSCFWHSHCCYCCYYCYCWRTLLPPLQPLLPLLLPPLPPLPTLPPQLPPLLLQLSELLHQCNAGADVVGAFMDAATIAITPAAAWLDLRVPKEAKALSNQ